ncbi:hypothetical protein BsWGS_15298 [Bradybaena similaris]
MVVEEIPRALLGGSASDAWNWSTFCGHGEDIQSWNENDFGHCFEQVAILAPSHTLLAIVSAYHFGRRKTQLGGNRLFVNWTWFLILRQVTVALLFASPVFQVIFSVGIEHRPPSIAEGVVIGLSCFSWLLHSLFVWNLRYLHSDSLRGPVSVLVCFLIVVAACIIHVHTVILRHVSSIVQGSKAEEYTTYINAGFCMIYVISVIPNRRRIYRTNLAFQVNETDGETEPLTWERIRSYNTVSATNEHLTITAEQNVGCLSWLTFHWVQNLMSRGAAMKISSVNDLYLLPERLNTHQVSGDFKEVLQNLEKEYDSEQETVPNDFTSSLRNYADVPHTEIVTSTGRSSDHQRTADSLHGTSDHHPPTEHNYDSDSESINSSTNDPTVDGSIRRQTSLFRALIYAYGLEYFLLGILKFLADSFGFAGPILLNYLVSFIENNSGQIYEGYLYALGLSLSSLVSTICSTQFDYNVQVVAYKIRCALITTIYKKSLSVSSVVQSRFTSGEIVNFMSTDTDRILNFCPSFHAFWSLPFQVGVALFLLYQQLGLAFITGLAFAVLLIPINRWIAGKIGELSTKMMKHKDERVKLMNELLSGIRVVKFYSWEQHFTWRINQMREKELKHLKGRKYLDAMCVYFWATTPVMISILTFSTHVLMGYTLTAAKVFTCLSLFLMLISPLNAFPWVINGLVEAWVSLKRVHKFVCLKDTDPGHYYTSDAEPAGSPAVWLKNASFTWANTHCEDSDSVMSGGVQEPRSDEDNLTHTPAPASRAQTQDLRNISLRIEKGQFVGVVGKVGSGKSSLLSALIGEMNKTEGEVFVDGLEEGFALVAQEPWVQQATVRDNILFGQPFNSQRYDQVLKACALVEDLKIMPSGDMTEIGENGITLSGGQRSRISLARAVYQNKSLYLLDDPLSAVDAHVAKHIYTHCIMGLLRSKSRILCTHHVRFLKKADLVVVMENGSITQSGLPRDVLPSIQLDDDQHDQRNAKDNEECDGTTEEIVDNLIQEEERQTGSVKADVYKNYWKNVGVCLSPLVLIMMFFMQASRNTSDWWLSYWVSHSNNKSQNGSTEVHSFVDPWQGQSWPIKNLTPAEDNLQFYLGIYGGLAGANSIFTLARSFLFAYGGICAATVVHKRLLSAVLKAPLSFFDMTPIGRIVNRFSSDLYAVDDSLPFTLNILLAQAYGMLGTLVITCYGLPWFAICLILMGAVYYKIQHYYRRTSRELKRLSSVSLSPIYAHFSETIAGVATIRAMRHSERFCEENMQRLDINQKCQYATQLSARWIDFRLRMLGVSMVTSLSLIAVVQHHFSSVNAGLVGLAISYSLSVTSLLGGVVMFFTETEKEFVSMERCQFYIDHTPSEKWDGTLFAPTEWPKEGVVEFDCVSLHYRDVQAPALNDVSFKTQAGEKIGIVGRTGAGKSSLFLALFRMVEVSGGRIIVDGVNVRHLDLSDIRSRFVAIPQDPFLFSGSVRMNLDPTGGHSDLELWSALDRCHLRSSIERMGGLEAVLTQRGKEFSVGQRQLLCLARAMLTKAKIICIDEATASVDLETDSLIQNTIRQEFKDSTVFTIAHRVNTVLDSQRVLIMRDGMVAEFDDPDKLLRDPSSMFYSFVYGNT